MLTSYKIDSLVSRKAYPPGVAAVVEALSPLAVGIANRWMLGWPKQVKSLFVAGTYLEALRAQEQEERNILADNDLRHLAQHEVMDLYGLSPKPPM